MTVKITESTAATRTAPALHRAVRVPNALSRYYSQVQDVLRQVAGTAGRSPVFTPGWELPDLDDRLREFFVPSGISWHPLGSAFGITLSVLDLRSNPGTRTTKTNPSLLIVARAVRHIERTGERIVIVTPSSANKATALRDAVLRAMRSGLVHPDQLQIVSVVPPEARPKLWRSALDTDPDLRRRNPVVVYRGQDRVGVKGLVQRLAEGDADDITRASGARLWFTLDLDNYRVADVLRAFVEQDYLPPSEQRLHAHSVSSAFGLLGHAYGVAVRSASVPRPGYFLIQHLDTPDMVLGLCTGSFDRAGLPAYSFDRNRGLFVQDGDPHFPFATHSPDEVLDPTFYTHRPATQPAMKRLIEERGGGGIVVSLYECLHRYPEVRHRLSGAGIDLPADPCDLREWSLVMAMTGVFNAAERKLIAAGTDVIVHGSGSYSTGDFAPIAADHLREISGKDLSSVVTDAARP